MSAPAAVVATGADASKNANNPVLALKEADLKMMLAAKVHLGTKNADSNAHRYIWRRRPDGVHIINLGKTWEKILLAARIIAAVENPEVRISHAKHAGPRIRPSSILLSLRCSDRPFLFLFPLAFR